jgi:hypothetical protein
VIDHLAGIWGYCSGCERWRYSTAWHAAAAPACPECGTAPALLERRQGERTWIELQLEVAVGPVGNRRFL